MPEGWITEYLPEHGWVYYDTLNKVPQLEKPTKDAKGKNALIFTERKYSMTFLFHIY